VHVLRSMVEAVKLGGLVLDLQAIRPNPRVEVNGRVVCEIDGVPPVSLSRRCRRGRRPIRRRWSSARAGGRRPQCAEALPHWRPSRRRFCGRGADATRGCCADRAHVHASNRCLGALSAPTTTYGRANGDLASKRPTLAMARGTSTMLRAYVVDEAKREEHADVGV
jgi:hypothetical protein